MARNGEPGGPPADPGAAADMMRQFTAAVSGMSPGDVQGVLRQLIAAAAPDVDPFARAAPPSRRRPRRLNVVTYRVRVDLKGTKPPLWRRLELSSDLLLDEVHQVIQEAFGWTDSHLHQFGSGPDLYSPETELLPVPVPGGRGRDRHPRGTVRIDEVLVDVGDKLFYNYDFGDDWQHVIKLKPSAPRPDPAPRAVCTDGRRDGPAEDCGGVYAYQLITAATDPTNPDHTDAVAEFEHVFGGYIDPEAIRHDPLRHRRDQHSARRASSGHRIGLKSARRHRWAVCPSRSVSSSPPSGLHPPGGNCGACSTLPAWTSRSVDAETVTRMVRPYSWLLDHVGAEGIKLTGAGYLPPVHVEAAVAALDLGKEWIGKGNREVQTAPVLHLRETATKMGLLRKHRGLLMATSRGRALRDNPAGLWWHLAERMPLRSADRCETQAGLLLLVTIAAGVPGDLNEVIARLLGAIGWISGDGTSLSGSAAASAAWDTKTVLRRLGGFSYDRHDFGPGTPTPEGIAFARASLRTWPS